jgi:glucan-binding repeat-containing protein
MQTGVQQWNRELYFFSLMSGKMLRCWIRNGALTYYADPESGVLYRNRTLGSYVFLSDGTLAGGGAGGSTGTMGWVKKKNKSYYYDETGQLVTGLAVIDGKRYVFNNSGVLQKGGWVNVDGVSYYAGKNGVLKTSQWIDKKYYVSETGARVKGFRVINDKLYYFGPKKGKLRTGRIKVNGKLYLAASNGVIKREKLF